MSASPSVFGKTVEAQSSSDTATASPRSAGAGELKDGQLSRDGRFRWNAAWGVWIPTGKGASDDLPGPLEWGPLMPERLHPRGCLCPTCWQAGVRYADYLKAKSVRDRNGF